MSNTVQSYWNDKRVFVTGATGVVGSWLVKELLAQQAFVVALVLDADPQSEFYRSGDFRHTTIVNGMLEDFTCLQRAINLHEIDTVFHLGAQTIVSVAKRNPLATFEANIRGTYNLLEACRHHRDLVQRIVVASSDKAYGDAETLPYSEDTVLNGRYPYDVSKSCVDLISRSYFCTYELPLAISRCGNIYGGGDLNWSRIVPGTIRSLLRRERPVIRSDGTFVRDYIYVKDVAKAYMDLAEALQQKRFHGEAFNFSPESALTVLEIIARIQELMDCRLEPVILNRAKAEIRNQSLCSDKARTQLGWQCRYTIDTGLGETIDWYRNYISVTPEPVPR